MEHHGTKFWKSVILQPRIILSWMKSVTTFQSVEFFSSGC